MLVNKLKLIGGNSVKLLQLFQVALRFRTVVLNVIIGKLVSPVQFRQALERLPTLEVFIAGKLVSPEQPHQALDILPAELVFIKGKLVRP